MHDIGRPHITNGDALRWSSSPPQGYGLARDQYTLNTVSGYSIMGLNQRWRPAAAAPLAASQSGQIRQPGTATVSSSAHADSDRV